MRNDGFSWKPWESVFLLQKENRIMLVCDASRDCRGIVPAWLCKAKLVVRVPFADVLESEAGPKAAAHGYEVV